MKFLNIIFVALIILLVGFLVFKKNTPVKPQPVFSTPSSGTQSTTSKTRLSSGKIPSIPLTLPAGFVVHLFSENLPDARDLQFSPGGTLIVSSPSTGEVIALPDKNGDGVADSEKVIISGENHPHGLAFYQGKLYVADVDQVTSFDWNENNLTASNRRTLFALPENSDHNNRTIVFNSSGQMFISLGSTCNVCNQAPSQGGSILVSDASGTSPKVFAGGLRNAAFLQINPKTGELWATEMGRDYLGDNTPPDEIDIIKQGLNYGWPLCYGDKIHDTNFDPNPDDPCGNTEPPIYQIGAHSAPLGLVFINSPQFPTDWQGDLLVAYHGSWNRSTPIGYKVVHMKVSGNQITPEEDFLTGFLQGQNVPGRPVDLTFDKKGDLYLSDDKAGKVYIIQKQ